MYPYFYRSVNVELQQCRNSIEMSSEVHLKMCAKVDIIPEITVACALQVPVSLVL